MSLTGFALANVGAFISFIPMLQILLPLKVMQMDPLAAAATLGAIAAPGAVVAGVSNVTFGWLSDRFDTRFGRRRPWIIAGLAGVMFSYVLIEQAHSIPGLLVAFAVFQLMLNMMFAPLLALIADRVPPARRGWAAALVALGNPVGTAIGTVVIATLVIGEAARYIALGALVSICVAPFVWQLGADPMPPVAAGVARSQGPGPWLSRNFVLGWLSRASVIAAFTVAQL